VDFFLILLHIWNNSSRDL